MIIYRRKEEGLDNVNKKQKQQNETKPNVSHQKEHKTAAKYSEKGFKVEPGRWRNWERGGGGGGERVTLKICNKRDRIRAPLSLVGVDEASARMTGNKYPRIPSDPTFCRRFQCPLFHVINFKWRKKKQRRDL